MTVWTLEYSVQSPRGGLPRLTRACGLCARIRPSASAVGSDQPWPVARQIQRLIIINISCGLVLFLLIDISFCFAFSRLSYLSTPELPAAQLPRMSVPYLINSAGGHVPASERIPVIARPFVSERAKKTLDLVSICLPSVSIRKGEKCQLQPH